MLKLSPICQRFDEKSCKIHVCPMPPFWIGFRCRKSLQASKTLFVYPLSIRCLGDTRPRLLVSQKFASEAQGEVFRNKYGFPVGYSVRITKTTLQTSHRDKISSRKTDKWVKTLTTGPVPHSKTPFTSGKEQILASPFSFLCTYFVPKSVFS